VRAAPEVAALAVEGYMTAEEVEDALKGIAESHPQLVQLLKLPEVTWEGRTSHAVRISADKETTRRGVLFTGSMHAREWGGSDICLSFISKLIGAYENGSGLTFGGDLNEIAYTSQQVRTIMERLFIYVFPDVNPDGKHYSQNVYRYWRKNRNPQAAVDINRNFDFLWASGIGTSPDPAWPTYKGTAPFSEPETRNVRSLFDNHPEICYYLDIHSYSKLILYPWGDDDNQSSDPAQNFLNSEYDKWRGMLEEPHYAEYISPGDDIISRCLARLMNEALFAVHKRCYTVEESSGLYPTSGTSTDYAFSRHFADSSKNKVYGFVIEFGEEFHPHFEIMKTIIKDVNAAMTELCWSACSL
jgi:murein tripeptide amidase MpaA